MHKKWPVEFFFFLKKAKQTCNKNKFSPGLVAIFSQAPADDSHNRKPQFASILRVTRVLIILSLQVMSGVVCSGKHGSRVVFTKPG